MVLISSRCVRVESLESRYLRSGSAVLTYGDHGIALPIEYSGFDSQAICTATNGELYVLRDFVSTEQKSTLTRLLPNGSIDPSFGGGTISLSFEVSSFVPARPFIVATPDGGVIVESESGYGDSGQVALTRFNANGTLDTAFASGGTATTTTITVGANGDPDTLQSGPIVIEPDGSVVWTIIDTYDDPVDPNGGDTVGMLAHLSSTGTPMSFGGSDGSSLSIASDYNLGTVPSASMLGFGGRVLFMGKPLLGSTTDEPNSPGPVNVFLQSFNADGTDKAESIVKHLTIQENQNFFGAVTDSKGRITVDGVINGKPALARFTANGKLDPAFGKKGIAVLDGLSFTGSESNNLLREPDGSFLIGGYATPKGGHGARAAVQHYSASGVFDPKYGSAGLGILTSTKGLLVGDAKTLVAGPNRSILVSTTLRDTVGKTSRQRLVVDDIAAG